MEAVTPLLTEFRTEALAVIAGAAVVYFGIPIAFKGIQLGRKVISKV